MFSSAVVDVTPSKMLSSAAVDVTNVPPSFKPFEVSCEAMLKSKAPSAKVVFPVIVIVEPSAVILSRAILPTLVMLASPNEVAAKVVAPVTASVPAMAVLPLVFATVNLLLSIVKPPLRAVTPVTVSAPIIPAFASTSSVSI